MLHKTGSNHTADLSLVSLVTICVRGCAWSAVRVVPVGLPGYARQQILPVLTHGTDASYMITHRPVVSCFLGSMDTIGSTVLEHSIYAGSPSKLIHPGAVVFQLSCVLFEDQAWLNKQAVYARV